MTKRLGPWVTLGPDGDPDPSEVRYPDPHDGRLWSLDGSAKWIVELGPCCQGGNRHYPWHLSDRPPGSSVRVGGNAKTREEARQAADEALRAAGWEF